MEPDLNDIIVELQHMIRSLRHEVKGWEATARNWKELYEREKAKNE